MSDNTPTTNPVQEAFRNLKFHRANEIVPDYAGFELIQDVHLRAHNLTLQTGMYFLHLAPIYGVDGEPVNQNNDRNRALIFDKPEVYTLDIDEESFAAAIAKIDEEGEEFTHDGVTYTSVPEGFEVNFNVKIRPVEIGEGRKLTIDELCLWIAVDNAEIEGGEDYARALLSGMTSTQEMPPMLTPDSEVVPVSKLAKTMSEQTKGRIDVQAKLFSDDGLKLNIGDGKDGNTIIEAVSFEFDEIGVYDGLTYDDIVLQEAAASVYDAGGREFSATSFWRVMTGNTDPKSHPSDVERARIEGLIKKQMSVRTTIDLTRVVSSWKRPLMIDGEEIKNPVMSPRLIEAVPFKGYNSKGELVTWYQFTMPPALYMEAKALGQISSYPVAMLKSGQRDSPERIAWRHYIMRRVLEIKNANKKLRKGENLTPAQRRIRYAAIANATGTDITDKDKKSRFCTYCFDFCKELKERGEIYQVTEYYKKQKAGRGRKQREGIELGL